MLLYCHILLNEYLFLNIFSRLKNSFINKDKDKFMQSKVHYLVLKEYNVDNNHTRIINEIMFQTGIF